MYSNDLNLISGFQSGFRKGYSILDIIYIYIIAFFVTYQYFNAL